jgi:Skp family chaperone for outer membrane proteins
MSLGSAAAAACRWLVACTVLALTGLASAHAADPAVAIVVDFQSVVRNSDAAEEVQRQIDVLRQQQFGALEEELRALEAELAEESNAMAPDEFAERRRMFERRVTDAQREAQARRAELDQALDQAMDRIRNQLVEVVAEIADEQGANVVLNRSQVVLFDQSLEFSEEALARLNEVLPAVEIEAPEGP